MLPNVTFRKENRLRTGIVMAESLFGSQCSKKEKKDEVSLQKQSQMERFERIFAYNFCGFVSKILLCFYYPSLLSDVQIGEDFELGYWSKKFAKNL